MDTKLQALTYAFGLCDVGADMSLNLQFAYVMLSLLRSNPLTTQGTKSLLQAVKQE
jgi:hypothetical protein